MIVDPFNKASSVVGRTKQRVEAALRGDFAESRLRGRRLAENLIVKSIKTEICAFLGGDLGEAPCKKSNSQMEAIKELWPEDKRLAVSVFQKF